MRIRRLFLAAILLCTTAQATTWYVRTDGGNRTQCTGTTDAAYPGSGSAQACAFIHPYWLFMNDTDVAASWVVAGGDTVILRGGPYKMGLKGPSVNVSANRWAYYGYLGDIQVTNGGSGYTSAPTVTVTSGCTGASVTANVSGGAVTGFNILAGGKCTADTPALSITGGGGSGATYKLPLNWYCHSAQACYMPPIPSGTSGAHTKFLGENWASCNSSNKTQLLSGYTVQAAINLSGSNYVDVQCFDLTDNAQCGRSGTSNSCSTSIPYDDFGYNGIVTTNNTKNILLKDIDVHGYARAGIIGAIGGTITVDHVSVKGNTSAGWNFDDGANTANSIDASVVASYLTVSWNGCSELLPGSGYSVPFDNCFDQGSGGYGDGVGTADNRLAFSCDHCTFSYNTQDGLDLLHVVGSATTITNSNSFANMGQQYKFGEMTTVTFSNNLMLHNCHRMGAAISGAPATFNAHLSNYCRASGDAIATRLLPTSVYTFDNNTFGNAGSTGIDFQCNQADCTGAVVNLQNDTFIGWQKYDTGTLPGIFFMGTGVAASPFGTRTNNVYYNMRTCPTGFSNEVCTNPLIVNNPAYTGSNESVLDATDFHLGGQSGAAYNAGATLGAITTDYDGNSRPQFAVYDIGAFELATVAPQASLSPSSLTFSAQAVGSSSPPQVVTLANGGSATLNISSITISGDYSKTTTCGATVSVGGTCTISVTFSPTTTGTRTGTLTVNSDAASSPNTVGLTGTGSGSAPPTSTLSSDFGAIVKSNSAILTWTTTNATTCTLNGSSVTCGSGQTQSVSPSITTAYVLEATGAGGTVDSNSVTILVSRTPTSQTQSTPR